MDCMKTEGNIIIFKSTPEFFIKGIQDKPPYSIRDFEGKEIEEVIKFHAEFEEGQRKWIRIVATFDPTQLFEREISDITWLSMFHAGKWGDKYLYGFAWEKQEKA